MASVCISYKTVNLAVHCSEEAYVLNEETWHTMHSTTFGEHIFFIKVINYKEYLPLVFGEAGMRKWRLNLGLNIPYDPQANPTLTNVFSTAAFRFGHSQVPFGNQPKSR